MPIVLGGDHTHRAAGPAVWPTPRPGGADPFRRAPGHLGQLLGSALHPRHAVRRAVEEGSAGHRPLHPGGVAWPAVRPGGLPGLAGPGLQAVAPKSTNRAPPGRCGRSWSGWGTPRPTSPGTLTAWTRPSRPPPARRGGRTQFVSGAGDLARVGAAEPGRVRDDGGGAPVRRTRAITSLLAANLCWEFLALLALRSRGTSG